MDERKSRVKGKSVLPRYMVPSISRARCLILDNLDLREGVISNFLLFVIICISKVCLPVRSTCQSVLLLVCRFCSKCGIGLNGGFHVQSIGKYGYGIFHFESRAHFNLPFAGLAVRGHHIRFSLRYLPEQALADFLRILVIFLFETESAGNSAALRV